jgi:aryl-alcohol dehydrogenase-like predicted oxidoreductase
MRYREISGEVELISELGIGGNIFGYVCDKRQSREILSVAKDCGVNFVDTADVYSEGRSEEMIGEALSGQRAQWIIASKVGLRSNETGSGSGSRKVIFSRIEASLRRLQTDYIDIYQLHQFDPITPVQETLDAMTELRNQGKIRHFGLSNFSVHQVELYLKEAQFSNLILPATNQIHYNILKRKVVDNFSIAALNSQPRLLAYGVLGRGVLSSKYRLGEMPNSDTRANMSLSVKSDLQPEVLGAVARLSQIGLNAGITMSQLALAYALRSSEVASALVGVRSIEQLEEVAKTFILDLRPDFWRSVDQYLADLGNLEHVSLGMPLSYLQNETTSIESEVK